MKNITFNNTRNSILKLSSAAFLSLPLLAASSYVYPLNAEPESFLAPEMIAAVGESKTNSLNTGTRASLSLGSNSSFGSSANVASTDAYKLDSKSVFVPQSGSWKSSFGESTSGNPEGAIKANVENIRSGGTGNVFDNLASTAQSTGGDGDSSSTFTPADSENGYLINASDAKTAEGEAVLEGVYSEIELVVKPEDTFTSTTIEYIPENADENAMATANGSANLGLSNSLNVDLSNTEFQNAFSQAF
tara:strand:- start:3862 stop:4602 length:741 start_codon:yes stop_codon:yes gene_type:complete